MGRPNVIFGKAEDNFRSCNVVLQERREVAGGPLETPSRAMVARRGRRDTPRGPNDAMGQAKDYFGDRNVVPRWLGPEIGRLRLALRNGRAAAFTRASSSPCDPDAAVDDR
jgi:hypothetical protein